MVVGAVASGAGGGWIALAAALSVVAVAATREFLRWRGRRWRNGPPRPGNRS